MSHPRHPATVGALTATLGMFPAAAVVTLFFRFPIPLVGYRSRFPAVIPALYAVGFYDVVLGSFLVLPCMGAIAGLLADLLVRPEMARRVAVMASLVVDLVVAILLATWDWIYGPW